MTIKESTSTMGKTSYRNAVENKTHESGIRSPKTLARLAGVLYLLLAVLSGWAFFNLTSMIVPGNAAETAANLRASEPVFRIGILSDLSGQAIFAVLVLVLYRLLKPVNKNQARLMVSLVIVSVALQSMSLINQMAALILLNGADYLSVFSAAQVDALILFFLNMHKAGFSIIAQVFFGLWLIPLGVLIYKSGFMPKILGILLVVAAFGYLGDVVTFFLLPDLGLTVSEFTFIGELLLMLWLLIKGVNVEVWKQRSLEAA